MPGMVRCHRFECNVSDRDQPLLAALPEHADDATVAVHPTAAEEFVTLRDKRAARR